MRVLVRVAAAAGAEASEGVAGERRRPGARSVGLAACRASGRRLSIEPRSYLGRDVSGRAERHLWRAATLTGPGGEPVIKSLLQKPQTLLLS